VDISRELAAIDRAELAQVCAGYPGVELVVVFGSVMRGQARPDSDVDIGVQGGGFWGQLDIGTDIGRRVDKDPHVVDLATASEWLRFQIARDGVSLFEGKPGVWTEFKAQAMLRYWEVAPIIALTADGVRRRLKREAEERRRG
jgi:predicted nucleotidyltransferase